MGRTYDIRKILAGEVNGMKYRDFRAPWYVIAWQEVKRIALEILAGLGFLGMLVIIGIVGAMA